MLKKQADHKNPRIILTGGGSGGHIVPLVALAHSIKEQNHNAQVIYIGLKKDKKTIQVDELRKAFDQIYYINSGKLRRYSGESAIKGIMDFRSHLLNFVDIFRLSFGIAQSLKLLIHINPDIVVSKGGYGALPVGLAAKLRKISIVTHDSDSAPGATNAVLGRWAKIRTYGLPPNRNLNSKKENVVGIPLNKHLIRVSNSLKEEYRKSLGYSVDDFIIVLSGGGLGSVTLNKKMVEVSNDLLKINHKVAIVHFSGTKNYKSVTDDYTKVLSTDELTRVKIFGFSSDFYKFTGAADLVIARPGASTIAELAMQEKAVIFFPAKFLAGSHQLQNSDLIKQIDGGVIMHDDSSSNDLFEKIQTLMQNSQMRTQLGKNLSSIARPSAAEDLARIILSAITE